jgi:hypothetical protein
VQTAFCPLLNELQTVKDEMQILKNAVQTDEIEMQTLKTRNRVEVKGYASS